VRFAHDKLREVMYSQALQDQLRELHGRAATVLEQRWHDQPDANRQWASIGHHFAAAQIRDQAARYLKLAADHAREIHANGDAIRLYEEAISHVNGILLRLESNSSQWYEALINLYEALGDVFALTAQRDQARTAYDHALSNIFDNNLVVRARLNRKTGKTWETQHQHEKALGYYRVAENVVCTGSGNLSPELLQEEIQIQLENLWVYYWLNRVPEMEAIVATIRPTMEAHGTPTQRAQFFRTQMMLNLRRDRYVVTHETLSFARAAVEACRDASGVPGLPMEQFSYGFALLFHNSFEEAEQELLTALGLGERIGDTGLQARCLTYLALAARMRGRIAQTEHYTNRSLEISVAAGTREYLAAAHGNLAWLALNRGDRDAAVEHGHQAVELWRSIALVFPFQWIALIPLLAASLQRGDMTQAVSCAESLLALTQQHLPGAAADALERARKSWHLRNEPAALAALESALRHLRETEYR
jgi:tetratricopeptide (TPR) repeat protein